MNSEEITRKIRIIQEDFQKDIKLCQKNYDFLLLRSKFLGNDSEMKQFIREIKNFSTEDKQTMGKLIQSTANNFEEEMKNAMQNQNIEKPDVTLPTRALRGFYNLISNSINEVKNIFFQMGYDFFETPEIETEFHNFTALNVHEKHSCRDDHQSFYLNNGKLLRTHCTSFQNYILKALPDEKSVKYFTIGRVFRRDSDATHVPMFHNVEGMVIAPSANVKNLFIEIKTFLTNFFETQNIEIRIRSSFFPFTEPSFEVDAKFENCWLEIAGCGITHPNVFKFAEKSPQLAFAFGFGLERLAMIKHKISDIRDVYSSNAFVLQNIRGDL